MRRSVILAWGCSGLALFWLGYAADVLWLRLAAKPVPAIALALFVMGRSAAIAGPVAVGLVFGAVGDVALEAGHFLPGLVAFLVGHLAYVVGFARAAPEVRPVTALPFLGFVAVVLALLWSHLGPMRAPVVVYALAIGAMMWRAAVRAERADDPRATLALVGAIAFGLSDALIALNRFRAPIHGVRVPILVLYWAAQLLVASSVPPRLAASPAPTTAD